MDVGSNQTILKTFAPFARSATQETHPLTLCVAGSSTAVPLSAHLETYILGSIPFSLTTPHTDSSVLQRVLSTLAPTHDNGAFHSAVNKKCPPGVTGLPIMNVPAVGIFPIAASVPSVG